MQLGKKTEITEFGMGRSQPEGALARRTETPQEQERAAVWVRLAAGTSILWDARAPVQPGTAPLGL